VASRSINESLRDPFDAEKLYPCGQLQKFEEFMGPGFGCEFLIEVIQREKESPLERDRREAERAARKVFIDAAMLDDNLPF
jgi:hypothetical protein